MLLGRDPALLKRHEADVVQRRVQSAVVVERQPVDHLVHGLAPGGKAPSVHLPTFSRPQRLQKTGNPEIIQSSDGRLTLSVPIQFKRRAGRKQVTLPNGEPGKPRPWDTTATALQLALARGHRCLALLESGEAKSLREIASLEGVDNSYVSRMVNLTTLAPDIVDAILLNELPDHLTLFDLAVDRKRMANTP